MKKALLLAAAMALLASCASTKRIAYFQDADDDSVVAVAAKKEIRIDHCELSDFAGQCFVQSADSDKKIVIRL